ncbi:MAG: tetratricopeptide repeat protein [Lachnospiraceae bacterium]|nr:tetratricopeptide repeat protein [Lachnospiraceae bacterium]
MDLSVIVSAVNMQRSIAACIRSVTRCPRDTIEMECIVVHNSSTDETAAIVNRYFERDSRIRLVKAHGNIADLRSAGMEAARGSYILFLEACDRLCEDAWEQIEAAVEEEYADFMAFSHITMNRKGKLKAHMLPIREVVSTDVKEARKLMYVDVVLDTCCGKLFRSDIIRDNHITFRSDVPGCTDFFFVVEYFEHCETVMLTKAMILYCMPQSRRQLQNYSMRERLGVIGSLYHFHMDAVRRCNDQALEKGASVHYLKVLAALFGEYADRYRRSQKELEENYEKALANEAVQRILREVDERRLRSQIRKYEYRLFKGGNTKRLRRYFSLKAGVRVRRRLIRTAKTGAMVLCMMLLAGGCSRKTADTNIASGMELVEQYDFQGAMSCFEQALLNNEDSELAYRGQGIACMGLGNYADAETAFLKSIENAGRHLTALEYDTNYYLASAYMKQGKYAAAEEIYSAIIALKKKEKDAYYLRACARLRQNQYEEAVTDFEKAFSFDSDNLDLLTDAYVEMQAAGFGEQGQTYLQEFMSQKEKKLSEGERGILYYYLGDYENARIYLDSFINGKDPKLSMILGQTYEKLDNMSYAAIVYQSYLDTNEPNAAIYNSLGVCLMHQEKYEEAVKAFESGIDLGASDYLQELRFNIIVANEYSGNFAQAKQMMQEYLQVYPDDAWAKKENEFLKTR